MFLLPRLGFARLCVRSAVVQQRQVLPAAAVGPSQPWLRPLPAAGEPPRAGAAAQPRLWALQQAAARHRRCFCQTSGRYYRPLGLVHRRGLGRVLQFSAHRYRGSFRGKFIQRNNTSASSCTSPCEMVCTSTRPPRPTSIPRWGRPGATVWSNDWSTSLQHAFVLFSLLAASLSSLPPVCQPQSCITFSPFVSVRIYFFFSTDLHYVCHFLIFFLLLSPLPSQQQRHSEFLLDKCLYSTQSAVNQTQLKNVCVRACVGIGFLPVRCTHCVWVWKV